MEQCLQLKYKHRPTYFSTPNNPRQGNSTIFYTERFRISTQCYTIIWLLAYFFLVSKTSRQRDWETYGWKGKETCYLDTDASKNIFIFHFQRFFSFSYFSRETTLLESAFGRLRERHPLSLHPRARFFLKKKSGQSPNQPRNHYSFLARKSHRF